MTHTRNSQPTHHRSHGRRGIGRWLFLAITLLVGGLLVAVAQAQPPGGHHGRGHHGFGDKAGHGPGPGIFGVDEDGDGTISAAEFQSFLTAADANGDGVMAEEELIALHQARAEEAGLEPREPGPRHDRMREHLLERLDQNDDGQLQVSEVQAHFAELDANGDGNLSGDEMPMHGRHERMREHMAGAMALRAADTDQDHNVTTAEWSAFLGTVDANGDGEVSFEELHKGANPDFEPPALTLDQVNEIFTDLDANGDGTVSEDELPRRPERHGPRGDRGRRGPRGI